LIRWLLAPLRAVLFALHVLLGIAIILLIFPWVGQSSRNRIKRRWSRTLIALSGARLIVSGQPIDDTLRRTGIAPHAPGPLVLANHISWMDIFAINAVMPARFVAKSEIRKWPLLGMLVTGGGTLYIERGRRHAVAALNHAVREHLAAGEIVVVFAEGTTGDGSRVLPFHSNMIAPAIDLGTAVWPVAVRYTEHGARTRAAAFVDDTSLLKSFGQILVARQLAVEICVLPAIDPRDSPNRHALARIAHDAIERHLGVA
jgi:1-acyl-sn-glycerol-3-phosphate acyltransferase